jgi:hypothetical protein
MRRSAIPIVSLLSVLLLAPASVLLAQSSTTGTIAGVVKDSSGAVLPGVAVEAASPALIEQIRTVVTDGKGEYKIVDLRPGVYTVTFTLSGFSTVKREQLELSTAFTATVNAELKIGSLAETLTVTGATPLVDVQSVRAENVLSREALDSIPTGKTIQGYVTLTVGATVGASGGTGQDVGGNQGEAAASIHIHGGHDNDLKLLQDGMSTNNSQVGAGGLFRWYLVNQAQTQEVTLETGGMLAESETGGVQVNMVPKDGGNRFSMYLNGNGTTGSLQSNNITPDLVARGVTAQNDVRKIYDLGIGLGGPILTNRLWFYTAHRWWGASQNVPGNFFNATQGQYIGAPNSGVALYTQNTGQQAYTNIYNQDHDGRVTWQASAKDKVTFTFNGQANCNCFYSVDQNKSPEGTILYKYTPYLSQFTYTHPASQRLLFEAGLSIMRNRQDTEPSPGVSPTDVAIQELSTGYRYNAVAGTGAGGYGTNDRADQNNGRVSASYVTGSHSFKTGILWQTGVLKLNARVNQDVSYQFNKGVPASLTEWTTPIASESILGHNIGLFAQDQWTLQRLTLNLGLRFDSVYSYNPVQQVSGGQFYPAYTFPAVSNTPNWKDLNPRLGAAYDLFGNGKTAVKGYFSRYVGGQATAIASAANPVNAMVTSATRTWGDTNGNFIPNCTLTDPAANGECGALNNTNFGTVIQNTTYDPNLINGFGQRDYSWQTSAAVQHELRPGMSVDVAYFRTWYGNFTATNNTAVTAGQFTPYCITAPVDSRLPGGGGNQICGLFDVVPSSFGKVSNVVSNASTFGSQSEIYSGIDVGFRTKFGRGGLVQGGVSSGRIVTDNCYTNLQPQLVAQNYVAGTPRSEGFCHVSPPWLAGTQVKLNGIYPLPYDFQFSATFQNLPGLPISATETLTNAQVAPSLGRNLAAGPGGTVTVGLIPPFTMFEDRLTQVDMRVTKIVPAKKGRLKVMVDLYNLFNANTIVNENFTYGASWLHPTAILGGRLLKIGGQFDF